VFDWDAFVARLRAYPAGFHRLLPPCADDRVQAVQRELGKLPQTLEEMLKRFNGAELFISGSPLVSFFRISTMPRLHHLEWASEWCIDAFTRKWRAAASDRQDDWAIAMTNYGGLVLLDAGGTVKEWDTGECTWLSGNLPLDEWIEKVINEGEVIMAE
jgi:hypothetical protein